MTHVQVYKAVQTNLIEEDIFQSHKNVNVTVN